MQELQVHIILWICESSCHRTRQPSLGSTGGYKLVRSSGTRVYYANRESSVATASRLRGGRTRQWVQFLMGIKILFSLQQRPGQLWRLLSLLSEIFQGLTGNRHRDMKPTAHVRLVQNFKYGLRYNSSSA